MTKFAFDMIPVFKPSLSLGDKASVLKSVFQNQISGTSPVVGEFEKKFSEYFGMKYGIAVSNGSVALDISLQLLDLEEGDEVIVPSMTIISCLSAILRTKATPVFCDVDINTWNMRLEDVKECFSSKTKAVVMVHTYGLTADINNILNFCKEKNLFIIEDASEAHGQSSENHLCGAVGDISTFSFYANKHVTTGEGGMLLTNNKELALKAFQMRNLDFKSSQRFVHENLYWNYRLSGIQASLGISQLTHLDKVIKKKIMQGNFYTSLLEERKDVIQTPLQKYKDTQNHYWVYGVVIKNNKNARWVMDSLREVGIETRPFFWPLHLQPLLPEKFRNNKNQLTNSELLGEKGLYIPIGNHLSKNKQEYIVNSLIKVLDK